MLDNCDIKSRWSGVEELISRWLEERRELIVELCKLSEVKEPSLPSGVCENRLTKFCDTLVDYVSAGHFEVYYQLLREAEDFHDGSAELATELLPKIQVSTEAAVNFNDAYSQGFNDQNRDSISDQLSKLGELLETRFGFEDRLIAGMHSVHRSLVTE